jgi:hypothetical protein
LSIVVSGGQARKLCSIMAYSNSLSKTLSVR